MKFLTAAELAEARVIATYGGYIGLVGSLGLGTSILTFTPRETDRSNRLGWLYRSLWWSGGCCLGLCGLGVLLATHGKMMTNYDTVRWFCLSLAGVVAGALSGTVVAFYQAEKNVRKLAGTQSMVRITSVALIIVGAWFWRFPGYIIALALASLASLVGLCWGADLRGVPLRGTHLPTGFAAVATYALAGNLCLTVGRSADVVIMDRFVDDRGLFGCYALALTILGLPMMVNGALATVAVPYFSARLGSPAWVR